jgi:hypothetical protein
VNRPSVESSGLTTARKIVPHATSPKGKRQEECADQGADAREEEGRKNSGDMQSE